MLTFLIMRYIFDAHIFDSMSIHLAEPGCLIKIAEYGCTLNQHPKLVSEYKKVSIFIVKIFKFFSTSKTRTVKHFMITRTYTPVVLRFCVYLCVCNRKCTQPRTHKFGFISRKPHYLVPGTTLSPQRTDKLARAYNGADAGYNGSHG